MKILVLCKRQYTGRDLLDDTYGRLFRIPEALIEGGHQVEGIALSYRSKPEGCFRLEQVTWHALNGLPFEPLSWHRYQKKFHEVVGQFRPDVVWCSSDVWHAIIGAKLCRQYSIPFCIDLYDNYESFALARLPGVVRLFHNACRQADGITVVTSTLRHHLQTNMRLGNVPTLLLGNAAADAFAPVSKQQACERLGLDPRAAYVGTAGALVVGRGIGVLLEAFQQLAETVPDCYLLLAGPGDASLRRYHHDRLINLGVLSPDRVPLVFNALDVAVICNRPSAFGDYCYPQKFNEILACRTPLLAANVGEMAEILADWPELLFSPASPESLAQAMRAQLANPVLADIPVARWPDRAAQLAVFLQQFAC